MTIKVLQFKAVMYLKEKKVNIKDIFIANSQKGNL